MYAVKHSSLESHVLPVPSKLLPGVCSSPQLAAELGRPVRGSFPVVYIPPRIPPSQHFLSLHTYLVARMALTNAVPLVRLPALHSAARLCYGCPSGPPVGQFLVVYQPIHLVGMMFFHQRLGRSRLGTGEGCEVCVHCR